MKYYIFIITQYNFTIYISLNIIFKKKNFMSCLEWYVCNDKESYIYIYLYIYTILYIIYYYCNPKIIV